MNFKYLLAQALFVTMAVSVQRERPSIPLKRSIVREALEANGWPVPLELDAATFAEAELYAFSSFSLLMRGGHIRHCRGLARGRGEALTVQQIILGGEEGGTRTEGLGTRYRGRKINRIAASEFTIKRGSREKAGRSIRRI